MTALGLAVLGHQGEAGVDRRAGVAERATVAAHFERPGRSPQPEQALEEDRLALALEPGEPADLAGVHDEIDVRDARADDPEADGAQGRRGIRPPAPRRPRGAARN